MADQQPTESRTRLRKAAVRRLLEKRDLPAIDYWGQHDRNALRTLTSLLFETDPLLQWRAIEALGRVAGLAGRQDLESVRRLIRRLLWLMNDESGGICWVAPEAIAEVMHNLPALLDEFGRVLASFLVEEPFEIGVRWGIARVGSLKREEFEHIVPLLHDSLLHSDPRWRGYALLALHGLGEQPDPEVIEKLAVDQDVLPLYDFDSGQIVEQSIASIAVRPVK